jgi:hypothetical protein
METELFTHDSERLTNIAALASVHDAISLRLFYAVKSEIDL